MLATVNKPTINKEQLGNTFFRDPFYMQHKSKNSIVKLMPYGLTFYKDFIGGNGLGSEYSIGSRLETFTVSRGATTPATYIDSNGVIQLTTTSNVPRIAQGYYDATGFHTVDANGKSARGLMIEAEGTNLVPKSSVIDDATWTETNSTADNADAGSTSPDGTATAPSLTATAANGNLLLTTAVTAQTFSVWLKRKTGTGTINITANGGTTWTAVTLTSSWARYQVTAASASQKCGVRIVTDTDAVYIWGAQFENNPYATSFIPTTTAALTRNAEVLKYFIVNNRKAAQETIINKFIPSNNFVINTPVQTILDSDTISRLIFKNSIEANIKIYGNYTIANADNSWRFVCWSPALTLFVAVAYTGTGNRVMTSPDGITWTIRTSAADNNWRSVCWSPALTLFVAVADSGTGNRVMTSPDGITWTIRKKTASAVMLNTIPLNNISYIIAATLKHSDNYVEGFLNGISEYYNNELDFINPAWGTYFYVGSSNLATTQLNGLIQKIAIFNRALTASEVQAVNNMM